MFKVCHDGEKINYRKGIGDPIDETNDENSLSMVKDIVFYKASEDVAVRDSLCADQLRELEKLAAEPDERETMTLNEFNKATG